jgi:phosphoserine aminotransferase
MVAGTTIHDGNLPPFTEWRPSKSPRYLYYCDNETGNGVEFNDNPLDMYRKETGKEMYDQADNEVLLVCDMSSNITSRPVDVSRYYLLLLLYHY